MTTTKADIRARALDRAAKALKSARVRESDSTTKVLRKLDKAMTDEFGAEYDTKLRPLGIALSEKVKVAAKKKKPEVTGSGTVKCRFPPMSCGPDVDF